MSFGTGKINTGLSQWMGKSQLPFGLDVVWYSLIERLVNKFERSQLTFGFEIDWHFDAVAQERDPPARLYVVKDFKDRIAGNGERPPGTATNLPFTGAWFNSVARQKHSGIRGQPGRSRYEMRE